MRYLTVFMMDSVYFGFHYGCMIYYFYLSMIVAYAFIVFDNKQVNEAFVHPKIHV